MRKVIHTAILGNYDTLKEPKYITPGWEHVCYTDQNFTSDVWEIIKIKREADHIRQARRLKINPPFEYSESLWMDGSFQIKGSIDEFISKCNGSDMMLLKHPHRKTIFEEAEAVIKRNKDHCQLVRAQIADYRRSNVNSVLPATGIIYRKGTEKVKQHSEHWLKEILRYSKRDQLSFGYAAQKTGVNYMLLNENIYDLNNKFFLLHRHNGK